MRLKLRPASTDEGTYRFKSNATYEIDVEYPGGEQETITVAVTAGDGEAILLPRPVNAYSDEFIFPWKRSFISAEAPTLGGEHDWRAAGLIARVLDMRRTSEETAEGDSINIVVDSPGVFATQTPISNQVATPFVLPAILGMQEPWVSRDALGNLYLFYIRFGACLMRRLPARVQDWLDALVVTEDDVNSSPAAVVHADGRLTCAVQRAGEIIVLESDEAGASWEEVATVAGTLPYLFDDSWCSYLLLQRSGGVYVERAQHSFAELLTYGEEDSAALVTTDTDGTRAAGRWLPDQGVQRVVVPYAGNLDVHISSDGGATWEKETTLEV